MDLDSMILRNIISSLDSTRVVSENVGKDTLLSIARQVVTRALQFDPSNKNLIEANKEVLRIDEKLSKRSKQRLRNLNIVTNRVPASISRTSR